MVRATIKELGPKDFRVLLGDKEIGKATNDVDARFHMYAINDALDVAYLEGQKYLERMVENNRVNLEMVRAITEARIKFSEELEKAWKAKK